MLPRLMFFCKLNTPELTELFQDDALIKMLVNLNAGVSLGTVDFSAERAEVVRKLNQAGVPVAAWLLLPIEDGYWSNLNNDVETRDRYNALIQWTLNFALSWSAIGLDFEPDIRLVQAVLQQDWKRVFLHLRNLLSFRQYKSSLKNYNDLIKQIHSDGYQVETYQLPIIMDDRLAHSKILQKIFGIIDLPVDREILMTYSSIFPSLGPSLIWSYGYDHHIMGVGSTGRGVDLPNLVQEILSWDEFKRDVLYAWHKSNEIYIFNLEGSIKQGYLERLLGFEWDTPIIDPTYKPDSIDYKRGGLQVFLWVVSWLPLILTFVFGITFVLYLLRKRK